MVGLLIAIFFGWLGGYRFYKKQIGLGIVYLLTFGIFGIGWIVDIIMAALELEKQNRLRSFQQFTPPQPQQPIYNYEPAPQAQPTFFLHSSKATEKNIAEMKNRYIVVDTETTGVDRYLDRMVSLSAIIYENGEPMQTFNTLINPGMHIPEEASNINHIYDQTVVNAPNEHDACKAFLEFCGDAIFSKTLFVAYNSSFDMNILKRAMERYGFSGNVRHFDVLAYARKKIINLKNYKQSTVAEHLGISSENAHNSLADCYMCANILNKLLENE